MKKIPEKIQKIKKTAEEPKKIPEQAQKPAEEAKKIPVAAKKVPVASKKVPEEVRVVEETDESSEDYFAQYYKKHHAWANSESSDLPVLSISSDMFGFGTNDSVVYIPTENCVGVKPSNNGEEDPVESQSLLQYKCPTRKSRKRILSTTDSSEMIDASWLLDASNIEREALKNQPSTSAATPCTSTPKKKKL